MANVKRTIPKQVLMRRRAYFKSIKKQLKYTFFVRGELKCVVCDKPDTLELHHILPLAMGGNNEIDNLMVLCHEHHVEIHKNKEDIERK